MNRETSLPLTERVYRNNGNQTVIRQLNKSCRKILDVGCGAGDNAALVKSLLPHCEVFGITHSIQEANLALQHMSACWVWDIEKGAPNEVHGAEFDAIIFSHVLEHLKNPARVVADFARLLAKSGQAVIAVPNVLYFPVRFQFLCGSFEYQPDGGILDDTHLHFYTYLTADRYLLSGCPELRLKSKVVDAHVPLPFIRGKILPTQLCTNCDSWAAGHFPNLFGYQIVLTAEKI